MSRNAFELMPKAERLIEFSEDDYRENHSVTHFDESLIRSKDWANFEKNALVITKGNTISQYAEEFPIVIYRCNGNAMAKPVSRLNTFIKSITVSTADYGKCFELEKREMKCINTGHDTVAYYTDNSGTNFAITQNDIFKFLLKKPYLVISEEGLLVFFTDKKILVTSDCNHYAWVKDINTDTCIIKSINVCDGYCIVNLEDTEKRKFSYKLQFSVDMLAYGMIDTRATKI